VNKTSEDLSERQRLRQGLTVKYREQADIVRLYGVPSAEKKDEIMLLRKELAKVDKMSIGKDDDRTKGPKRSQMPLKFSRPCAYPECTNTLPAKTKSLKYRKRHYCSEKCAHADAVEPQKKKTAKT
jgi:hypothetical protein